MLKTKNINSQNERNATFVFPSEIPVAVRILESTSWLFISVFNQHPHSYAQPFEIMCSLKGSMLLRERDHIMKKFSFLHYSTYFAVTMESQSQSILKTSLFILPQAKIWNPLWSFHTQTSFNIFLDGLSHFSSPSDFEHLIEDPNGAFRTFIVLQGRW